MADQRPEPLHAAGQVAALNAGMIGVEHQLDIACGRLGDEVRRLLIGVIEIAWRVITVQRFQQQRHTAAFSFSGGAGEIGDQDAAARRLIKPGGVARHDMDAGRAEAARIGQRLREGSGKLRLAAGQGGEAIITLRRVAADCVDTDNGNFVCGAARLQLIQRDVIRPVEFHRRKTVSGGGADALNQRQLQIQKAKVGGKPYRHVRIIPLPGAQFRSRPGKPGSPGCHRLFRDRRRRPRETSAARRLKAAERH